MPRLGREEPDDDVLLRHAGLDQFLADPAVGAVMLDPHLAIPYVDVEDRPVNPRLPLPADVDHLVMVALAVDDRLAADLAVRRLVTRVSLDQLRHGPAVPV